MTDDSNQRPMIAPPPGLVPSPASPPEQEDVVEVDESAFISLPPGVSLPDLDSGTHRLTNPRRNRQEAPVDSPSEPVFFAAGPGMAVSPTTPAVPVTEPTALPEPSQTAAAPTPPEQLWSDSVSPMTLADSPPPESSTADDATRIVSSSAKTWSLVLPDGRRVALEVTTLVGRRPAASPEWPDARLLPLDDTTRSVSKTHAALVIGADGGLTVHDLGSTNGTFLEPVGEVEEEVLAGAPRAVDSGAALGFGELTVTVSRA